MAFQALSAILVGLLSYQHLAFLNAGTFLVAFLIMQFLTPIFSQSSDGATIENSRAAKPDREESERAGDFCFFQTSGLGAAQDT
jgi:DHA3 family macrolide efflux protein-like MFS transporter